MKYDYQETLEITLSKEEIEQAIYYSKIFDELIKNAHNHVAKTIAETLENKARQ